jgi:hypothetical protein
MRNSIIYCTFFTFFIQILVAQTPMPTLKKTVANYGEAFGVVGTLGLKLDDSRITATSANEHLVKSETSFDFRDEYTLEVNQNGLQNITFYFDKDNHAPLYELILEFEDADTLAALCEIDLGASNHPRLEDHWIMNLSPEGVAFIMWRFENKIIMAANLPDTELAGDYTFEFDQEFINNFYNTTTQTDEVPATEYIEPHIEMPADQALTEILNEYISQSTQDFAGLKGDAIEGKKDEYQCNLPLGDHTEYTNIRKKSNNTWRLESKISANEALAIARIDYESAQKSIENLEALNYRLVKKSEYSTNTGNTYIWEVQNLDGITLNVIMKLQLYAAGDNGFAVRLEVGK